MRRVREGEDDLHAELSPQVDAELDAAHIHASKALRLAPKNADDYFHQGTHSYCFYTFTLLS